MLVCVRLIKAMLLLGSLCSDRAVWATLLLSRHSDVLGLHIAEVGFLPLTHEVEV